jgi:hypothetical protein
MPGRPGPDIDDEPSDLNEPARREMVIEATAVFGEEAGRDLAALLRVPFETSQPET